jgi:hypothetical protein
MTESTAFFILGGVFMLLGMLQIHVINSGSKGQPPIPSILLYVAWAQMFIGGCFLGAGVGQLL